MLFFRKIAIFFIVLLGTQICYSQNAIILSQKITFDQNPITIGEILKELIYYKKLNLSYSPDAMNFNEIIHLPSNEMIVKDVLFYIGNKSDCKIIILDKQVIIKKNKQLILNPAQKSLIKNDLMEQEIISRTTDSVYKPLCPLGYKNLIPKLNYNDTISKIFSIKYFLEAKIPGTKNEENVFPKTSRKQVFKSTSNWLKPTIYIGGGIDLNLLSVKDDSGMLITTRPMIGCHLQTEFDWKISSKFNLELSFLLNLQNNSIKNSFVNPIIIDSIVYSNPRFNPENNGNIHFGDTVSFEKVDLRLYSIEIPVLLSYSFQINRNLLNVGIGAYLQMKLFGKYQYFNDLYSRDYSLSFDSPTSEVYNTFDGIRFMKKYLFGISAKIAYQRYKWKINFEVKYPISKFSPSYTISETRYSISLVYQILSK